jgi:hypothetical protein
MNAALPLPPQAPATSEQLAAVLRAVRNLAPAPLKINDRVAVTVTPERSAAWAALVAHLQAYALLASIPADSALSGVPRDLRAAHALWSEVREATALRLTQEARGHARGGSPLAEHVLAARKAAAAVAVAVDRLFEDLTEDRL